MKKITLKQAALAAERAYRRGFQHGVCAVEKSGVDNGHATNFRFDVNYDRAWSAPELYAGVGIKHGSRTGGFSTSLVERLLMENPEIADDHKTLDQDLRDTIEAMARVAKTLNDDSIQKTTLF